MKHLLIILPLLLLSSPLFGQSTEKPCYISVNASDEFNQTLLSNMSISIISQYFKEIKPLPPGGLSGTDNCIYDVTVFSSGGRTFVTLQGKDMNSFGDSDFVGIDGFQQSLLKSLYRSLSDKRELICEGYGEYLEECGGGSSLKSRRSEEKKCYLTLESSNKKNIKLYTNISVSIVSQYVTKVEKDDPLIKRPLGKSDSCLYEIVIEQTENTLFTTVTGEGLNSYGDSKLKGIEGFQQSLLKSLFRSLRDKRGMICDDYRDLLEECKGVVVEEIPKKVEPKVVEEVEEIPKKVEPKVVEEKVTIPKVEEPKPKEKFSLEGRYRRVSDEVVLWDGTPITKSTVSGNIIYEIKKLGFDITTRFPKYEVTIYGMGTVEYDDPEFPNFQSNTQCDNDPTVYIIVLNKAGKVLRKSYINNGWCEVFHYNNEFWKTTDYGIVREREGRMGTCCHAINTELMEGSIQMTISYHLEKL
jgi:hypothetical protein